LSSPLPAKAEAASPAEHAGTPLTDSVGLLVPPAQLQKETARDLLVARHRARSGTGIRRRRL